MRNKNITRDSTQTLFDLTWPNTHTHIYDDKWPPTITLYTFRRGAAHIHYVFECAIKMSSVYRRDKQHGSAEFAHTFSIQSARPQNILLSLLFASHQPLIHFGVRLDHQCMHGKPQFPKRTLDCYN